MLGVVLAWAVSYSGSLWSAIITHSANDCLTFVIFGI
jgi:membrane protease YdiL (CAAX protease family)